MKVEIQIDAEYRTPKAIILTREITREVSEALKRLSEPESSMLVGYQGDSLVLIEPEEVLSISTSCQKVFVKTETQTAQLRQRRYALEAQLPSFFLRISQSEIVNMQKVKRVDMSAAGTISLKFASGDSVFASRRYMHKVKKYLGL